MTAKAGKTLIKSDVFLGLIVAVTLTSLAVLANSVWLFNPYGWVDHWGYLGHSLSLTELRAAFPNDPSGDLGKAVLISEGLGHGFLALADNTVVAYLVSTPFSPGHEFEINPLDEKIGINWGMDLSELKMSDRDKNAPTLAERLDEGILPR